MNKLPDINRSQMDIYISEWEVRHLGKRYIDERDK